MLTNLVPRLSKSHVTSILFLDKSRQPEIKKNYMDQDIKWFTLRVSHIIFLRRVYKAARVTRVGGLSYLDARFILAGGLNFSLVKLLVG